MGASNTRFTQNSLGQSKTPIDSDHGIYRYRRPAQVRSTAPWRRPIGRDLSLKHNGGEARTMGGSERLKAARCRLSS